MLPTLKADAVFLSPPWGGPEYQASEVFDLHSMIPPPLSALEIFRAARAVTPNVIFFLPRNVDINQVAGLPSAAAALEAKSRPLDDNISLEEGSASKVATSNICELEKQFLNGKLKTTTAYFGEDIVGYGKSKPPKTKERGVCPKALRPALANVSVDVDDSCERESDTMRAPAWSGRHVRFRDDGENTAVLQRSERVEVGSRGNCEEAPYPTAQVEENNLYEAWMAKAAAL